MGSLGLSALSMCDVLDNREVFGFPTSSGMGVEEAMYNLDRGKENNTIPEVRPELKNNPHAVFIFDTHVDAKKDENGFFTEAVPQLHEAGKNIASHLFVKGTKRGGSTFIKPNFTGVPEHYFNRTNGVYSSPDFIAGVVEHLRDVGNQNLACGDGPIGAQNHRLGGVYEAFDPYEIMMIEAGYERFEHYNKKMLNWVKTDNSLIWKRVPYYRPILDEDNFLINIATMKCHLTALTTLTVKNLQGCVPRGYGQFCWPSIQFEQQVETAGINFGHFQKDFMQLIEQSFLKHRAAGFKRWEYNTSQYGDHNKYEQLGGWDKYRKIKKDRTARREFQNEVGNLMRQEMWIQRGIDNAENIKPDINIIEGIIAMDGNEHNWWEIGDDYLVNTVIAGCSPYEVDAVGNYVMGHDPSEIWYNRVAKEKNLGECDINKIEIYKIRDNGEIVPVRNLSEIKRNRIGLNWAQSENPNERLFW
ncbi:DUF362 domain-containing protein [Candidatus Latescibacterota bacterium]